MSVKKVLLLPGIGDIHWVFLYMEDFMKQNGIDKIIVDVWNYDGRPRSKDFINMVDFAEFGQYITIPEMQSRTKNIHKTEKFLHTNFYGHDYFFVFNGMLHERGLRIEQIMPQYKINWDYKINFKPEDETIHANFVQKYGKNYILCYISDHGMFKFWVKHLRPPRAYELLRAIHSVTGLPMVLTGKPWDLPYALSLKKLDQANILINNVGQTETLPQFLYLVKNAKIFLGFCGGNTMLSSHFGVPTMMMWSNHFREEFMTNWIQPEKIGKNYWPFKVEWSNLGDEVMKAVGLVKSSWESSTS